MPNIPIPDLTPGKIYDLRIQYVGGITGYLYWSDVVRCMVNNGRRVGPHCSIV